MKKIIVSIVTILSIGLAQDYNYSLSFDGVDDYVALPTLNDADSIGTISAWASFNSVSFAAAHTGIYSVGNYPLNGSSVSLLGVHAGLNNNLRFGFYTNTWYWVDSGIYPSVDTWYNVVGTWGSDGLKIYVNGELKATNGSYTGGIPSDDNHYIGSGNSANSVIDGKIDEVSIWSTALSLEQIQSYMSTQLTGNESGLVGYWNFNTGSGTTLTDQTSNGNDGTIYGATWSTDVPSILSIDDEIGIPDGYTLKQNYPNPFNPVTTLRYDLPENSLVTITIYDMLGRVVNTLVQESQTAGYKSVIWNATNSNGKPVSAGIYLYQIQAGEYLQTKKMVLLK